MVALNQTYNVNELPEMDNDAPIPKGTYAGLIVNSEMKDASTGGKFLELEIHVTQGDYKGRKIYERLNLVNANNVAVEIAQKTLGAICRAVNVEQLDDSVVLHNKPFTMDVDITEGKPYMKDGEQKMGKPQNRITKYYPATQGGTAQAPQQAAQTAAASGPSAPAGGAPPWAK